MFGPARATPQGLTRARDCPVTATQARLPSERTAAVKPREQLACPYSLGVSIRRCVAAVTVAGLTAACSSANGTADPVDQTTSNAPSPEHDCGAAATREVVVGLLADITADDVDAAEARFAPEPGFQWYSDIFRTGAEARDRTTLRQHLESLAAATTTVSLANFRYNGSGNFQYVISKVGANGQDTEVVGKGAVECTVTAPILVWSEGGAVPWAEPWAAHVWPLISLHQLCVTRGTTFGTRSLLVRSAQRGRPPPQEDPLSEQPTVTGAARLSAIGPSAGSMNDSTRTPVSPL